MSLLILLTVAVGGGLPEEAPRYEAEAIFPPNPRHTHGPSLVACPNGDLLASWFGEVGGGGDDAAIFGARKRLGDAFWSEPFVMADRPGFSDVNPTSMIDRRGRLWLFWPTVIGGSFESCLMNFKVASEFTAPGPPRWEREGLILLKPENFQEEALRLLGDGQLRPPRGARGGPEAQKAKLGDPLYQRLGWASRCKPTVLPSGRILLPLYSDTFAISIMAVSDDEGETWYASKPLIGFGNIQPTVLRREDGALVAFMRESGPRRRIRYAESRDDGLTWGPVGETALPNPGSSIDGVRLANGHWVLVYNDSTTDRARLAVTLSEDEGRTWKWSRHLERHAAGRYHYPAVIQARDGLIHVVYSRFIAPEAGAAPAQAFVAKGIQHAAFNEAWLRAGAAPR